MVFQQFNLFPHMTVAENCMLAPMRTRKMSKAQAREVALKYLDRVRIKNQADKFQPVVWWAATTRGHCPCSLHEP